jgi:hypothetical protein
MYQEAIEQAGREMNIFEFAKWSLTCPRTEFGLLQPNPECERVDAALAAMCQPEDDEFEDFPLCSVRIYARLKGRIAFAGLDFNTSRCD